MEFIHKRSRILQINKIKIHLILALIFHIIFQCHDIAFAKHLPKIAPPYVDPDLTEFHHKKQEYKNILGYLQDEYLLLYGNHETWLFDMNGKQYREWNTNFKRAHLLENCNLMVIDNNQHKYISEKNTAGEAVWTHHLEGRAHHDLELSHNGEHVTLFYSPVLPDDVEINNQCENKEVSADSIIEIDRQGNTHFEWKFHEHYISKLNEYKCNDWMRNYMKNSKYSKLLDWVHPNALNIIKDNKWYRKGYKEFTPGNLIVTAHHFNKIIIIEKTTGKVIWVYVGDELGLERPHEAKMIPEGLPGAGNILIYDNGIERKYTRIIEVNPINKKVVWSYQAPGEFYNKWAGSQQRLKNGDTFISDDGSTRAFIVNKKGEIKWQFIKPNMNSIWVKRAKLYPKKG
jgi:hypothetical protein